jgi:ABC-type multidrug transport system ATPase subunit
MIAPAIPSASLEISGVTVRYDSDKIAVDDLTLHLVAGEVFGLVGPNGAGKSSLLNCAAGLLAPVSGFIAANGEVITGKPQKAARHVALMPDPLGVYLDVTVLEYMRFFAQAYGLHKELAWARIDNAVDRLGLEPWLLHEVEALSSGWQRRLALTRVLIADAPIVLLDEPAAGLDVSGRRELLRIVRSFAAEGRAVLVTSHILPELEELADRFGIIQRGKWIPVRDGQIFFTRNDLRGGFAGSNWWLECSQAAVAAELLGADKAQLEPGGDRIRLIVADREEAAAAVDRLVHAGHKIYRMEFSGHRLDDIALHALDRMDAS